MGGEDYWIVKTDASGNIMWQNTIGGSGTDELYSIQQTLDSGYILGGMSSSNISVDKTENSIGLDDFWMVKTDASGNVQWENTIGGSNYDWRGDVRQTTDGGYLVGGLSASGISGDKTENSNGGFDYWLLKTNSAGIILWQTTIGGSGNDYLYGFQQTADGGFFLSGASESDISGDKTENSNGGFDYWIVKLYPVVACSATANVISNIACFGGSGSAYAIPSGGIPPYTYQWIPSGGTTQTAANLSAGTYTVSITDAGSCTSTTTVTLTEPPPLTANATTLNNVSCPGSFAGELTVNAAGGTGAYTYQWSPSGGSGNTASNLSNGTYTVMVTDANGCSQTSTAVVAITNPVTANISSFSDVLCFGSLDGWAIAAAGGGDGFYSYLWIPAGGNSATASNLSAGLYTVIVTDSYGCTSSSSIVITEPLQLTAVIGSAENCLCFGDNSGNATVSAGGGNTPYTYLWLPSGGNNAAASNLSAGVYTVTVADSHGCITASTVQIAEPPLLITAVSGFNDASCSTCSDGSAAIDVNGGTGPYNYLWTPFGGNNATASNLLPGTYICCVTDANGCSSCSSVLIGFPSSVNEASAENGIFVFPNPAGNSFTVQSQIANGTVMVYDITGKQVMNERIYAQLSSFDVQLSAGIFFVKVSDGKRTFTEKLVIE